MNKIIVCLLLSLCFYTKAIAQSKEQKAVVAVLESQRLAWNKGNIEEYMQGYWKSDSLVFVGKNGPQYGWNKTLQNYQKSYPNKEAMGELQFNFINIEIIGQDQAFVLGQWKLTREKDEPQGFFTLRLKKIKGEWKVVYDHSS
jgi:ketosteroid isomerase-like protein